MFCIVYSGEVWMQVGGFSMVGWILWGVLLIGRARDVTTAAYLIELCSTTMQCVTWDSSIIHKRNNSRGIIISPVVHPAEQLNQNNSIHNHIHQLFWHNTLKPQNDLPVATL
jgi:hypothetical protein